ncbi:MAG: hypothetical protein MUE94_06435 [Verrucomicrobia bacterium]|jgi:hypothetical protein|nr:hypothetical protein [Verrucomicrobiota bacterium]
MPNACIEVDLTFVDEDGELRPGAIEALSQLRASPCELILGSAAGAEYLQFSSSLLD